MSDSKFLMAVKVKHLNYTHCAVSELRVNKSHD